MDPWKFDDELYEAANNDIERLRSEYIRLVNWGRDHIKVDTARANLVQALEIREFARGDRHEG